MPLLACGPFLLALALASCGEKTTPSAAENRQLDNAADMLDQAPDELANVDDTGLGNAEPEPVNTAERVR